MDDESTETHRTLNSVIHKLQLEDDNMNIHEYHNNAVDGDPMLYLTGPENNSFQDVDIDVTNNNVSDLTQEDNEGEHELERYKEKPTIAETPVDIDGFGYEDVKERGDFIGKDNMSFEIQPEYDEHTLSKEPSLAGDIKNDLRSLQRGDRTSGSEEFYGNDSGNDIFTANPLADSTFMSGEPSDNDSADSSPSNLQENDEKFPEPDEPSTREAMAYISYITPPENDVVTSTGGEICRGSPISDLSMLTKPNGFNPEAHEEYCNTDTYHDDSINLQREGSNCTTPEEPSGIIIINGFAMTGEPENERSTFHDEHSSIQVIEEDPITTQTENGNTDERPNKQNRTLTITEAPITEQPKKRDSNGPEAPCRARAKRSARKKPLPESMREVMIMPWNYDPCDDLDQLHTDHKALCCKSFWCPAWTFAENAKRLGKNGCLWGLAYCFIPCIPGGLLRSKVREVRDIDGDPWDDCGLHWFCCCHFLSLVQETVELKVSNFRLFP